VPDKDLKARQRLPAGYAGQRLASLAGVPRRTSLALALTGLAAVSMRLWLAHA